MANGFTDLQRGIFNFVKHSSHPTIPKLCEFCGKDEEEVRAEAENLAEVGYLRIDEGKNGDPDRVKPHPDRKRLLWQIKI